MYARCVEVFGPTEVREHDQREHGLREAELLINTLRGSLSMIPLDVDWPEFTALAQTHGVLLWDVFPQYQAPASMHDGEWNHIKIVLSGQRMNLYVNHEKTPSLKTEDDFT